MPSPHPLHFLRAMLVLFVVSCHIAPAVAGFVSLLDNVGRFSIVDTDTGIADTEAFGLGGYTNLAFNSSNNLYYTTDSQNMLRTITESGIVSNVIGQLPQLKGLAFDQSGSLFGYDFSSDQLVSIDPNTALYNVLGSSGFVLDGPGNQLFDTGSGLVVVMDQFGQGVFGSLDRNTGSGTTLFTNDDLIGKQILGFARPSGFGTLDNDTNLYLSDSISLYTLDLATGAVAKGQNIQYSSCDCVPEPTSFVLFGATIVLPFLRPFLRKKRRKVLSRLPSLTSLGGLSASAHKRFQRFFMSPHSKKQHTRRVVLESLEPRMLMTVEPFHCDSDCTCCQKTDGSTSIRPATGFGTTYGQSMGDFSLAPSAVQEANYSSNTTIASNGMYGNSRLTETTPTLVLVGTTDSGMQHIQLPWSGTEIRNFRQTAIGGNTFQSDTGGTDQITRE